MKANDLIILSYHKFVDEESEYPFSRTYFQFRHDLEKKVFDIITIDDGLACTIRACKIMESYNRRAKLFICTSLVGTPGYCNWDDLRKLSRSHDIENHSHDHVLHSNLSYEEINKSITKAQRMIESEIGKAPRYFVAPFNTYKGEVDEVCERLNLITLKNRETIKNTSK